MLRSMLVGLAFVASLAVPSAVSAASLAPASLEGGHSAATQIQYDRYGGGCPPGYRVTSHGGCKISHYLRNHPQQNPYNYGYDRQYYYNDQPRYYRHYNEPYYQGDDDDGNY